MEPSSLDSLTPLIRAFQQGDWGSSPDNVYYFALEALARERNLPFRQVKMKVPYYPPGINRVKEATASAMVLSHAGKPVLCDLHGHTTPKSVAMAFVKRHDLDVQWPDNWKTLSAWEVVPPMRYPVGSPSQDRLDKIIEMGRSILCSLDIQNSTAPATLVRPSRRI